VVRAGTPRQRSSLDLARLSLVVRCVAFWVLKGPECSAESQRLAAVGPQSACEFARGGATRLTRVAKTFDKRSFERTSEIASGLNDAIRNRSLKGCRPIKLSVVRRMKRSLNRKRPLR